MFKKKIREASQKEKGLHLGIGILIAGIGVAFLYVVVGGSVDPSKKIQYVPEGRKEYVVELRDSGFFPQELTVHVGDTVKFISRAGNPFWPASDLHPTHGLYPEFDPRQPIEPDKSWSFRFEKVGEWRYHDHLNPYYRATIIVLSKNDVRQGNIDIDCPSLSGESRLQCWRKAIDVTLQGKSLAAAFDVLADFYVSEPLLRGSCHDLTHIIGGKAYQYFSERKDLDVTDKTSYCGFGFYHGFMETMLLAEDSLDRAREFCDYVDRKLAENFRGAVNSCFHGIGHGVVDGSDPRIWGDPQAMAEAGFGLCKKIVRTDFEDYLCATGVFNSLELLAREPKYKLSLISTNPFRFCAQQLFKYQEACYSNMIPLLLHLTQNDFEKASRVVENIEEQGTEPYAIRGKVEEGLFYEFIRVNQSRTNYIQEGLSLCRDLQASLPLSCVRGLAVGHIKYGEPEKEYESAFTFCRSSLLTTEEREICFRSTFSVLTNLYSNEQITTLCQGVERQYRSWCGVQ